MLLAIMLHVSGQLEGELCMMQCDGCRALVHMDCYGEEKAPQGQSWLCDVCALGKAVRVYRPVC